MMKKVVCLALLLVIGVSLVSGVFVSDVSADENYYDNSDEWSDGPGVAPDDGAARDEPRTRFKDA